MWWRSRPIKSNGLKDGEAFNLVSPGSAARSADKLRQSDQHSNPAAARTAAAGQARAPFPTRFCYSVRLNSGVAMASATVPKIAR